MNYASTEQVSVGDNIVVGLDQQDGHTEEFGSMDDMARSTARERESIIFSRRAITWHHTTRQSYNYGDTIWNLGLPANTLSVVKYGTHSTELRFAYYDSTEDISFVYGDFIAQYFH